MYYTNSAPEGTNGTVTAYAGTHIDRTNVFFAGLTGKGGRIVHLINGSRFVCGRKFKYAPYILNDNGYTIEEFSQDVRGVTRCDRCFNCMNKVSIDEGDVKIDLVKLSQMHFRILSEAIANSILLTSKRFNGVIEGMAISEERDANSARQDADNVVLSAFKLRGKQGVESFELNPTSSTIRDTVPDNMIDLFTVSQTMMRHGQISIINSKEKGGVSLMLVANSSIVYYLACDVGFARKEDNFGGFVFSVTPKPYENINFNNY